MKVKSESEVTQSCATLSDPMDCSLQGSSVHGTFQARVLEWGAIAFSRVAMSQEQKSLWNEGRDVRTGGSVGMTVTKRDEGNSVMM